MYFNRFSERMTHRIAGNAHGFVHLVYNETNERGFSTYLRLFSYFSNNNSKQLSSSHIADNVECNSLIIPRYFGDKGLYVQDEPSHLAATIICGTMYHYID